MHQTFAKATGDLSAYSSLARRLLDASKTDHMPLLYSLEKFLGDDPKLREMSVAAAIASAAIGNFCDYDEETQRSLFVSGACSYIGDGALKKLPKDQQQALKDRTHALTRLMLSLDGEPINGLNADEVDGASLWYYRHDGRRSQENRNLLLMGRHPDVYVFAGNEYATGDERRQKHNVRVRPVGKLAPAVRLARMLNRNSSEAYVDSLAKDIESVSAGVLEGLVRHSVYTPSGTIARLRFAGCKNPNDNIEGYYAVLDRNSQTYLIVFNNSSGGGLIIPEGNPHLITSTLQGMYPHRTIDGTIRGLGDGYIKQMPEDEMRRRGLTGWENAGFDPWKRGRCIEILHSLKERR